MNCAPRWIVINAKGLKAWSRVCLAAQYLIDGLMVSLTTPVSARRHLEAEAAKIS